MIRSTKVSFKFANANRKETLSSFIDEYNRLCQFFVDMTWEIKELPALLPKEMTDQAETYLSARVVQCAAKQASGIVRGTREKQKKREFAYQMLLEAGETRNAKKLKAYMDKVAISKPEDIHIQPELDSRMVEVDMSGDTSFDGWLNLVSLGPRGNEFKIQLPFKKTKHFNGLLARNGERTSGVRISKNYATFMFDIQLDPNDEAVKARQNGVERGLDLGIISLFTTSAGQASGADCHGWTLQKIMQKIARKKKGSKGCKKTSAHMDNHTNWSLNQLDLVGVKLLRTEDIKYLRYGKRMSIYMSAWLYRRIMNRLELICEDAGVQNEHVNPTYTSQRCNKCGWTRKRNRKGKIFRCTKCGHTCDADLNAARNIALKLPAISKKQRLQRPNIKGFYWLAAGQEPIVPDVKR